MSFRKGINNKSSDLPKLVRDKIPKLIKESGKECICSIENERDILTGWIAKKIVEELDEYRSASTDEQKLEEAADMYEICLALWSMNDLKLEDIAAAAEVKRNSKGGFKDGIILWDVIYDKMKG